MVSFRFHLVSLVAVFLALGLGIAFGATVVDKATVELLEDRVDSVARRADRTFAQNVELQARLRLWDRFAEQAGDELVRNRLAGVDVLVVAVQGMPREPVDDLRQSLERAGARVQGAVWFTSKLRLDDRDQENAAALAEILGTSPAPPDAVRRALVARLAESWAASDGGGLLRALREAAFVDFETTPGVAVDIAALPAPGTRFVVVSSGHVEVANDQLAAPLAVQLARASRRRVLAAEPGRDADGRSQQAERELFVGPLRQNGESATLLSTVDNIEDFRGRVAAVLALADLGPNGKVGHFGVGPRATRLVPEPAR